MVRPYNGVFIWIGWQYVSLATSEIFFWNLNTQTTRRNRIRVSIDG
jgi:hypothetical protein